MTTSQKNRAIGVVTILALIVAALWLISEPKFETLVVFLSALATSLTLYASRKRGSENREPRFISKPGEPFRLSVALWGPSGSGKSWLVNALGWTLQKQYSQPIDGLSYFLERVQPYSEDELIHAPESTAYLQESLFRFERCRTSNSENQVMSSFKYEIRVFDNRGEGTIRILEDEGYFHYDPIFINLVQADIVIVALDPTLLGQESDVGLEYCYTPAEYAGWVRKLFSILERSNPYKQKYYAVCVMKADTIPGVVYAHPRAVIEGVFGGEMTRALSIPDSEHIDTFVVSSFGIPPKSSPKFDPSTQVITDKENWRPYGVPFPFFWAFESVERMVLKQTFSKTLWQRLTTKWRLRRYISYPRAHYGM